MKQKYVLGIVALAIVAILGISMVSAFGFGKGFMNTDFTEEERAEMQTQRQSMQTAIADGDYATWETLMLEKIEKMKAQITEENFNNLVTRYQERAELRTAMQEARESGDFSEFQEMKGEYGFEGKRAFHGRHSKGSFGGCGMDAVTE